MSETESCSSAWSFISLLCAVLTRLVSEVRSVCFVEELAEEKQKCGRSEVLNEMRHQRLCFLFFFVCFRFSVRQEGVLVPHVVRCCVEEVERRGMDEVGIYRVSGTTSDISALKAAFNSGKKRTPVFCRSVWQRRNSDRTEMPSCTHKLNTKQRPLHNKAQSELLYR